VLDGALLQMVEKPGWPNQTAVAGEIPCLIEVRPRRNLLTPHERIFPSLWKLLKGFDGLLEGYCPPVQKI